MVQKVRSKAIKVTETSILSVITWTRKYPGGILNVIDLVWPGLWKDKVEDITIPHLIPASGMRKLVCSEFSFLFEGSVRPLADCDVPNKFLLSDIQTSYHTTCQEGDVETTHDRLTTAHVLNISLSPTRVEANLVKASNYYSLRQHKQAPVGHGSSSF